MGRFPVVIDIRKTLAWVERAKPKVVTRKVAKVVSLHQENPQEEVSFRHRIKSRPREEPAARCTPNRVRSVTKESHEFHQ